MASKSYFWWTLAIILLTLGMIYIVDPRALMGLLVGIGRVVFVILTAVVVVLVTALFFGPVEQ